MTTPINPAVPPSVVTPRKPKLKPTPFGPMPGDALRPLFDELAQRAVQAGYTEFRARLDDAEARLAGVVATLGSVPASAAVPPSPYRKPWWQSKRLLATVGALLMVLGRVLLGEKLPAEALISAEGVLATYILGESARASG